jgi:hypothetical protein
MSAAAVMVTRPAVDDSPRPPCLQELVARFGTYDRISVEAWAEHDAAIAKWQALRLLAMGLPPLTPQDMKERRRAKRRAAKRRARPPGAGDALEASAPLKQEQDMDMKTYAGSVFLKIDNLASGPRKETIAGIKIGSFDRPELTFESGDCLSLNATNSKTLLRCYGPNSDDWIGKTIELFIGETTFKGATQPSVLVRPISPAVPKTEQRALPPLGAEMNDEIPF